MVVDLTNGLPQSSTEATIQKLIDKYTKQLYEMQVEKLQEQLQRYMPPNG
mgnify:CR=1 FL=1